jgi:threonine dehydratase
LQQYRVPELKDVYAARDVVSRHLKPTPLISSRQLSKVLGCRAYLKLENLQPTRAFKVRGGINYMDRTKDQATRRGVITASTGNHAQSVAYAGYLYGIEVKIVMPHGVPRLKVEAVKDLGAEAIEYGAYYEEARRYAEKLASEKDYLYVHGINEPLLYEGVGTMHLEIVEELPDVDIVINPIGGGSGAASAYIVYKALNPRIRIIGVQAEGAQALYLSWKKGTIVSTNGIKTAAEGLAAGQAYELPLKIFMEKLDDIVLVTDDEMKRAVRSIFQSTGQVAELAGAASTAAAFKIKDQLANKKVVLLLSGGNIESSQLAEILKSS